ncbi:MAG: hypothetical protein HRU25_12685 [Psychrobium sp.]|nr:hypothetical protein [Psychrobium sp.]
MVDEIFSYLPQYKLKILPPMTLSRALIELRSNNVHGIVNITDKDDVQGCLTRPIFHFFNVIVVYKKSGVVLHELSDLKGKSIVSFARSKKVMGVRYARVVVNAKSYTELAKQINRARYLVDALAQVSVGDLQIFLQSLQLFNENSRLAIGLDAFYFYRIDNVSITKMAFNDKKICQAVNDVIINYGLDKENPLVNYQQYYNVKQPLNIKTLP